MNVQQVIEKKLRDAFDSVHQEVVNESGMHNVPPGSESHFKVTVVSENFAGQGLVSRHRMINQLLSSELAGPLHALSIQALTPEEWFERVGRVMPSPPCLGGSKADGP